MKTVLFYSVLILVLPIGSFFATKSLLFEWFLGQVNYFNVSRTVAEEDLTDPG